MMPDPSTAQISQQSSELVWSLMQTGQPTARRLTQVTFPMRGGRPAALHVGDDGPAEGRHAEQRQPGDRDRRSDLTFNIDDDIVSLVAMPLFHIGGSGWALVRMSRGESR